MVTVWPSSRVAAKLTSSSRRSITVASRRAPMFSVRSLTSYAMCARRVMPSGVKASCTFSLVKQYQALLATENVQLAFTPEGITRLAHIAYEVNERTENIGARRLATVMERLLDEVSFGAARLDGQTVTIDAAYVDARLGALSRDEDLSRYIL